MKPIVEAGRNCWKIARAERASVIVDAADYYSAIARLFNAAKRRIFIAGWDFDTRIALNPDPSGRGETLGHFFLRLARENPNRSIDILKWNFGALKQFFQFRSVIWLARWWRTKAIDFRFDRSHPLGCSHHQKIVVIDDSIAACGGIDIAANRWDTSAHDDNDPRRTDASGKPYAPWHDATMLMQGEIAGALAELGRGRWKAATKQDLVQIEPADDQWLDDLPAQFRDVEVAVARTRAAYDEMCEIREIETLYIDMIAAAERLIYFENQYFTSGKIAAAIAQRLAEQDPPEFVLVMPRSADGWLEQKAMDGARVKLCRAIARADHRNRFRIFLPVTKGGQDIYVHAKVSIVDDRFLRVGSSNLNNRSLGLDSECDVAIDAALPANAETPAAMTALRHRLLAEHLACTEAQFAEAERQGGSMLAAIEKLSGTGKTLVPFELEPLGAVEEFIADKELLDPESADQMLDPIGKRGIRRSWELGRKAVGTRLRRKHAR